MCIIINMLGKIVETAAWKGTHGLAEESEKCRLRGSCVKGVMHLVYGCEMLACEDYFNRHNNLLKISTA